MEALFREVLKYSVKEALVTVRSLKEVFPDGGFGLYEYEDQTAFVVLLLSDDFVVNHLNLGYITSERVFIREVALVVAEFHVFFYLWSLHLIHQRIQQRNSRRNE